MNRYEHAGRALLARHNVDVRKWRTSSTGVASVAAREIECPIPRGPVSFGVLAHEVGHVVLHQQRTKPRWQEEVEAWEFALRAVEDADLGDRAYARVEADARDSIRYAFQKAIRRGASADLIADTYPTWYWPETRSRRVQVSQ